MQTSKEQDAVVKTVKRLEVIVYPVSPKTVRCGTAIHEIPYEPGVLHRFFGWFGIVWNLYKGREGALALTHNAAYSDVVAARLIAIEYRLSECQAIKIEGHEDASLRIAKILKQYHRLSV